MSFDWDGLGTLVPVVLWLLFLLLRKIRPQAVPQTELDEQDEPEPMDVSPPSAAPAPIEAVPEPMMRRRSRRRRHDETDGFERDYDPIEPSW